MISLATCKADYAALKVRLRVLRAKAKLLWKEFKVVRRVYPFARARIDGLDGSHYPGSVRMQIAYHNVYNDLLLAKESADGITGATVYIAIGLAYLLGRVTPESLLPPASGPESGERKSAEP